MVERYAFIMKTDLFHNGRYEMYMIGMIQGLIYGLCAIPCNTTLWDSEKFTIPCNTTLWDSEKFMGVVIFPVDCTEDHCKKVMEIVNAKWPGICHYEKRGREL